MGCGMSRSQYQQYSTVDDANSTPLESMRSRCGHRRRHGPPGPCARRAAGFQRRPPWCRRGTTDLGNENRAMMDASPALSYGFASPASIPEGFRQPLEDEKWEGGLAASFRDDVEAGPPRYSKITRV